MKSYTVQPAREVRGAIEVPGDKSISHRAVMLGSLAGGTTVVRGFLRGGGYHLDPEYFSCHGDRGTRRRGDAPDPGQGTEGPFRAG